MSSSACACEYTESNAFDDRAHSNRSWCRYTADRYYQGDIVTFGKELLFQVSDDPVSTIRGIMAPFWGPVGVEAWCWVSAFGVFQAALQLLVPGSEFKGPVSPKGNVPVYKVGELASAVICAYTPSSTMRRGLHVMQRPGHSKAKNTSYILCFAGKWATVLRAVAGSVLPGSRVCASSTPRWRIVLSRQPSHSTVCHVPVIICARPICLRNSKVHSYEMCGPVGHNHAQSTVPELCY